MLFLPDDKMFVNKFTDVKLPTKAQIFARTGQRAVTPNGVFTKDDPASFGKTPTESANEFVAAAESFEQPADES